MHAIVGFVKDNTLRVLGWITAMKSDMTQIKMQQPKQKH